MQDVLEVAEPELLSTWLSTFITEATRADGQPYPLPLENPLTSCLRMIPACFKKHLATCDNVFKLISPTAGVGVETKLTSIITERYISIANHNFLGNI